MMQRIVLYTLTLFFSLTAHGGILGGTTNTIPQSLGDYTRPEDYPDISVGPMQYIPTPSGNSVALRVIRPAAADGTPAVGPFPVILVQSAYNTGVLAGTRIGGAGFLGAPDPFMVKRGYVEVSVDVIGSGASEGGWELIGREEQNGYDAVVDWIKQQPWYNGQLGVSGISYMALTAVLTAEQRPDDVKAVFAGSPLGDAMRGTADTGGLINGVLLSSWVTLTHFASTLNAVAKNQNPNLADRIDAATQRHIDQIDAFYLPLLDRLFSGDPEMAYDSDFWRIRSPLEHADRIKAPTFVTGALDDVFQRGAPMLYDALKNRVDTRLVLYAGTHIGSYIQALPGTKETIPLVSMQLQWFDKYLKGIDSGVENIPQVTQYVKNYDLGIRRGFSTAPDWPHPDATPDRWYLHGSGALTRHPPVFMEKTRQMAAAKFATINYGKNSDGTRIKIDVLPNDGSDCSRSFTQWTLGFAGVLNFPTCFYNDAALEQTALNYETAPLLYDYYINGPIEADLWISSTTPDAVLSVRIDSVTPQGDVIPLTNGLQLASMRAVDPNRSRYIDGQMVQPYHYFTRETQQLLVPGKVTKVRVEVFPTSALVRAGSRLRISITPSNQAQGVLNDIQRTNVAGGVTTLYNSARYPSSVVVLSVPTSDLN